MKEDARAHNCSEEFKKFTLKVKSAKIKVRSAKLFHPKRKIEHFLKKMLKEHSLYIHVYKVSKG